MTDRLLQVCTVDVAGDVFVLDTARKFPDMVAAAPYNIIVPTTNAMQARLPTRPADMAGHKAFPDELPVIHGFGDKITIITSMQRPRKMSIVGSDMRSYPFLCKPEDDLRKDNRLMDFTSLVNKLLQADPDSRQRQLRIRTYAVMPLNETCGLIEWVRAWGGKVGGGGSGKGFVFCNQNRGALCRVVEQHDKTHSFLFPLNFSPSA